MTMIQRVDKPVKRLALFVSSTLLLATAGNIQGACEHCTYPSNVGFFVASYAEWDVSTTPWTLTYICDGVEKVYDPYPTCAPIDDAFVCTVQDTIEVQVTTYVSPGCGAPDWQLDPTADPTEEVPDCSTQDGTWCGNG